MTNKDLAKQFKLLGDLMELHQENPFKIRSYSNAYITLRKLPEPVVELSEKERSGIKGIGKAINAKITELASTGKMATLERYIEDTPKGIIELLQIKGLGPKKIRVIWKDLGVEDLGELLYAINENRLIELSGFGAKTQEDLRQKLEYYQQNIGNVHYASLFEFSVELKDFLLSTNAGQGEVQSYGTFAAQETVGEKVQLVMNFPLPVDALKDNDLIVIEESADRLLVQSSKGLSAELVSVHEETFGTFLINNSALPEGRMPEETTSYADEKSFFDDKGLAFIPPAIRHLDHVWSYSESGNSYPLIQQADIKGVIHNHSTFSDGMNTMEEMVQAAQSKGYSYMLMTDHSKSAFYANGLKEERLVEQWAEIDTINSKYVDFTLLKGIECDILSDGSLDYGEDVLKQFDAVIISVHSNLRMDEEKATNRILKAIENPYAHILGHPTGRLLLSRKGYPLDHKKIIDACASNGVQIELNANPWRLDLDPSWIPYAMERGVKISINPDAHSVKGIEDIKYGVLAAQSGGLTKDMCLNAESVDEFMTLLKK